MRFNDVHAIFAISFVIWMALLLMIMRLNQDVDALRAQTRRPLQELEDSARVILRQFKASPEEGG